MKWIAEKERGDRQGMFGTEFETKVDRIVAAIDLAASASENGLISLYVNGQKVGEQTFLGLTVWAGGDAVGLGQQAGGSIGGDDGSLLGFGSFTGDRLPGTILIALRAVLGHQTARIGKDQGDQKSGQNCANLHAGLLRAPEVDPIHTEPTRPNRAARTNQR